MTIATTLPPITTREYEGDDLRERREKVGEGTEASRTILERHSLS